MKTTFLCLLISIFSAPAFAEFPKNNLDLEDNLHLSNITEQEFNNIIDSVGEIYIPIAKQFGARLTFTRKWESPIVNANADQRRNDWRVSFFGGMARRPEITKDGFAMVVCHEVGHHLAGFPFYGAREWGAAEGQADYFATHSCAKKLFAGSGANISSYKRVSECDAQYNSIEDRAICYRTVAAGESLALLMARAEAYPDPSLSTPSTREVVNTHTGHAEPQCRLDTYFKGSLCSVTFPTNIIPGKNHPNSQTSREAQNEAFKYSCSGTHVAARPRCWFATR